jgi:hypothetical protein
VAQTHRVLQHAGTNVLTARFQEKTAQKPGNRFVEEEEEGLQGVFKRLRRNGHQLEKGCCEQLSSDCHTKGC